MLVRGGSREGHAGATIGTCTRITRGTHTPKESASLCPLGITNPCETGWSFGFQLVFLRNASECIAGVSS